MLAVHVDVNNLEYGDVEEEKHVGDVQQTAGVEHDCPAVERENIGVLHQRTAAVEKFLPDMRRTLAACRVKELLKLRGSTLLTTAIAGVVVIKNSAQIVVARKAPERFQLLRAVVELTALLAFQEEQVYLAIIIGQGALARVANNASQVGQGPHPEAPRESGEWRVESGENVDKRNLLRHQAQTEGCIDAEEPHVAGKAVEHTAYKRFLVGEAGKLAVGRVAEVGEHQEDNTADVVGEVGVIEHQGGTHAQEDGKNGDGIGVNSELLPNQGKEQADGACKNFIEPLFRVFRFY